MSLSFEFILHFSFSMGGKKKTGLGKALINQRFKTSNSIVNSDGSLRHTKQEEHVNMQSITQENDLEAFLNTATLAGTEFIAGTFY